MSHFANSISGPVDSESGATGMASGRSVAAFISILGLVVALTPGAAALSIMPFWNLPAACIALFVFRFVLCWLVAADARRRNDRPVGWVVLVLMFGLLTVLVYALTRTSKTPMQAPAPESPRGARYPEQAPAYPPPEGADLPLPEGLCPSCNAKIGRGIDLCPRCGERRR